MLLNRKNIKRRVVTQATEGSQGAGLYTACGLCDSQCCSCVDRQCRLTELRVGTAIVTDDRGVYDAEAEVSVERIVACCQSMPR